MATPTTAQQKAIADLYIALFNRAPDANGFAFWTQALADGASLNTIAQNFVTTPEARTVYPESQTAEQFVSAYYSNVLGRPIDANGLAFWTQLLQASGGVGSVAARANVVSQIVEIVNTPLPVKPADLTDEAYALTFADRNAFKNKGEVAVYFAVEYKGTDLTLAKQVLAVVGPTTNTIDAAKALLNPAAGGGAVVTPPVPPLPPVPIGLVFDGTSSVDTFIGQDQDDTFNFVLNAGGAGSTLTTGDSITGGGGIDRLNLKTSGLLLSSSTALATISGVETIAITATSGTTIFDVGADVKTVISDASGGGVSFQNMAAGAKFVINAATGGHQSAMYTTFVTAGALDIQGGVASATSVAIQGDGLGARLASVVITSSGAPNALLGLSVGQAKTVTLRADSALTTTISGSELNALTITGPAAVNLGALSAQWATVNASANTGGLTATVGGAAQTINGSAGDDVISTGSVVLTSGSVNAGAGTDRLIVNSTAALANDLGLKYTGFEIVRVANGVVADLTKIAGITGVEIVDVAGSTGVALGDATQAGNVTILSANPSGAIVFGSVGGFDTLKATVVTKLANGAQNIDLTGLTLHNTLSKLELTGNDLAGDATGLVTLTTTNARSLASIVVKNAGGAAVTVSSGHNAANLSIDASQSDGNVTINAAAYSGATGATVKGGTGGGTLTGSRNADLITGGAGDDVLIGDGSISAGTKEVQTIGFSGQTINAGTYTLGNYVVNVDANQTASSIAEAIVGVDKAAFLLANPTVENITYQDAAEQLTVTYKATAGDVASITSRVGGAANFGTTSATETIRGTGGLAAASAPSADTLTGGGGKDTFVFVQNSSVVTAFDTITDLNLGSAAVAGRVDMLGFHNANGVASVVSLSGGQQTTVTEAGTLAAAVDAVLGVAATDGATVQFTYAGETYIVHNGDGNTAFDNSVDFLVKVTGVTGTLDVSDIVLMAGVTPI